MKTLKLKPFVNKRNNQISIVIPRKKVKMFKKNVPKKIEIEIKGIEW